MLHIALMIFTIPDDKLIELINFPKVLEQWFLLPGYNHTAQILFYNILSKRKHKQTHTHTNVYTLFFISNFGRTPALKVA